MSKSEKKSTFQKRKEARYSPYAKGVKNEFGETVIRSMTKEEKAYLDRFNNEFVDGTFSEDGNLHDGLVEANAVEVRKIRNKIKKISNTLKKLDATGYTDSSGENRLEIANKARKHRIKLEQQRRDLKDKLSELDVKASIRHSDYARSTDPLNFSNFRSFNHDPEAYAEPTISDRFSARELDVTDMLELNNTHLIELIDSSESDRDD